MLRILWLFFSLCYIQHNCIPTSHALSFLYVFLFLFLSLLPFIFLPHPLKPLLYAVGKLPEKIVERAGERQFLFFLFFTSFHFISLLLLLLSCTLSSFPLPPFFFFSRVGAILFLFFFLSRFVLPTLPHFSPSPSSQFISLCVCVFARGRCGGGSGNYFLKKCGEYTSHLNTYKCA